MTGRRKHWPRLLNAIIAKRQTRTFEWGKHDCAIFAADVVQAITGRDYAAPFRGKYKTERGAYKVLRRLTGVDDWREGLIAWMDLTDMDEIGIGWAQRGDVVLIRTEKGPALAIVGSPGNISYGAADTGLLKFDTVAAERAWRVGNPHIETPGSLTN